MSDPPNPARIERDLDETRSRLGSHLSELQDRLSPGQVLDDLMGYFRGSEGGAFGHNLVESIRSNPMPAALTGIGLVWLMASNPRPDPAGSQPASAIGERPGARFSRYGRDNYDAMMVRLHEAEQGVTRHVDEADQAYSERLDTARGQAIGLARHTQETAASFSERVRDALSAAQSAVIGRAHDVRDRVGGAIGSLGAAAQSTAQDAAQYAGGALSSGSQAAGNLMAAISESPVVLGALGLAAGALLGALLPQSDQEEAALGSIARQARDTATSLAGEGLERGKRVAQAVAEKARDSAEGHGLTGGKSPGELVDAALSGDLAGHAKAVLQDVLQTGDEAVRREVGPETGAPPSTAN